MADHFAAEADCYGVFRVVAACLGCGHGGRSEAREEVVDEAHVDRSCWRKMVDWCSVGKMVDGAELVWAEVLVVVE